MRILVFEFITGGGLSQEKLPVSLAKEGLLMLRALLDGLVKIQGLNITVMLDWRLTDSVDKADINTIIIRPEHDFYQEFIKLTEESEAVWPIAPEFDGILHRLSLSVEDMDKILLTPSSAAVAAATDKFKTFQLLSRNRIPTVVTQFFDECREYPGECIVKPVDGVGCSDSYVIRDSDRFAQVSARLHGTGRYIIQPHVYGKKTSLSCLFKQGQGWLLSVNLQKFKLINHQYRLLEILVNYHTDLHPYQALASAIAEAVPGLWGYAGIDLIETPGQLLVLEINPRLTTSFAGLNAALGINTANLVLQLLQGEPVIQRKFDQTITVNIEQVKYES